MKAEKIFSRRKGFSLIELFVAMIIIAAFTSFITTNITSQSQSVKSEAEKLAAHITDLTRKADRRHINCHIKFNSDNVYSYFGEKDEEERRTYIYDARTTGTVSPDKIVLSPGFTISSDFTNLSEKKLTYDSNENEFSNKGKIIITNTLASNKDDKSYYIHFRFGRVRASETVTDLGENEE